MEKAVYYNDKEVNDIQLSRFKNKIHGEFTHDVLIRAATRTKTTNRVAIFLYSTYNP